MSTAGHPHKRPQVLLIEDERELAEEIKAELHRLGYPVDHVDTLAEGLRAAQSGAAGILILDRMLHGADSLAMMETLREQGVKTPVLVISGLSTVDERIRGLKAGGDDYLVKPFAMGELAARVEALLRRLDDIRTTKLRAAGLEMDLIEQTAMLLERVWNYRFTPETNVVDVHIGNLRRKIDLGGGPSLITNIRGAGFMFSADA
jgi:two-component system OmpR family response regulator